MDGSNLQLTVGMSTTPWSGNIYTDWAYICTLHATPCGTI